jgi:glycosyltransferase involved in cell wall biosynthesis
MADVAVYHPVFGRGGAESVCMHVLEALQDTHRLTLISMNTVDFEAQNEYFDTSVDRDKIEATRLNVCGRALDRSMNLLARLSGKKFGRLHAAVFSRFTGDLSEYDLVFSTAGELIAHPPSIQYIHYPWYNRSELPDTLHPRSTVEETYDALCQRTARTDKIGSESRRILTNSNWTADLIQNLYQTRPEVVYPPVAVGDFEPQPWDERKRGFVCVGRISPAKNIHRNIQIIDRLRDRGHDVHLHIVGPVENRNYYEKIEQLVEGRSYVFLHGKIPRNDLIDLVCSHQYAIHGMEYEHFGIAVAEFVAGGAIPLVPNSGGQVEIVNSLDEITYDSMEDAVRKADTLLSDTVLQRSIIRSLPDVARLFGPGRFKKAVRKVVDEILVPVGNDTLAHAGES